LCTPAGVVQDGLATGTLDDVLFIVHSSMIALGAPFCCSACSVWYFMVQIMYIGSYVISECILTLFISQERQGWMDAFG